MPADAPTKHRILIVEDDPAMARLIRRCAENRGHETAMARNGREALETVCTQFFDAILSDIYMPEMNGIEFARRMRLLPWYKTTPLIFLTAKRFEIDEQALFDELNLTAVVSKPFRPSQIEELISATLEDNDIPAVHAADGLKTRVSKKFSG